MKFFPEDYKIYVLEDLRTNAGISRPVHASLLERLFVRKAQTDRLHPNPSDEFCDPEIGPNYEIVARYVNDIRVSLGRSFEPFTDPLQVQKISTGGYRIMNGHHRWLAAKRTGYKKLPVQLVNPTSEEKILLEIGRSRKKMCASFDLDEVLLTDGERVPEGKKLWFPFNRIYQKNLRNNAGLLVKELSDAGFDVWVYTGNYWSEEYIRILFILQGARIFGVVSGTGKKKNGEIRQAFRHHYDLSLHIDNDSIVCVNTVTGSSFMKEVGGDGESWASDVMHTLKEMNL